MPIKTNGYYNDPNIAQAATNLAAAFAPPSGADAHGWAEAAATTAKAKRLADFFATATDPNSSRDVIDRSGIGSGSYNPNASYYSVDATNATGRANNEADNARALQQSFLTPVAKDATRFVPPSLADAFGVPQLQSGVREYDQGKSYDVPGIPERINGPTKPLSKEEVIGGILQTLPTGQQQAVAMSGVPVESIVTPQGPRVVNRMDAVGQEPYNPAVDGKPTNGLALVNGQKVAAYQGSDKAWYAAQTNERLPANVEIFHIPQPQGSANDVGLNKSVNSTMQEQLIAGRTAISTIDKLMKNIAENPASQGWVGDARGFVQDAIATGGELGKFFGGQAVEVDKMLQDSAGKAGFGTGFDPNIPAQNMLAKVLAYQYARLQAPDGRGGVEAFKNAETALGLTGFVANQPNSLAKLQTARKVIEDQYGIIQDAMRNGVNGPLPAAPGGKPDILQGVANAGGGPSAPLPAATTEKMGGQPPAGAPPGTYQGRNGRWYVKQNGNTFEVQP